MIPIDADVKEIFDIEDQCLKLSYILGAMENAGNHLNIIILDACRDNPYLSQYRKLNNGLARIDAPTGSFIAFATGPGTVASDGNGRNGVFTKYLLKHMKDTNLKIEDVIKQVRIDVMSETDGKQIPWQSSSLIGDFYFIVSENININLSSVGTTEHQPPTAEIPNFDEIIDKQKILEQKWGNWQTKMNKDFTKAKEYESNLDLSPKDKAIIWKAFITAYEKDNPYGIQDNILRQKANSSFDIWNTKTKEEEQNVTTFIDPPPSIQVAYTPWMDGQQYQNEFNRQARLKHYPKEIEGRNSNGKNQFRAIFVPYPPGKFTFFSYHGQNEYYYNKHKNDLASKGFKEISNQYFCSNNGAKTYQSTWVKRE